MKRKSKLLFSNFKLENWENLILFAVFSFYLSQFGFIVGKGSFPREYGEDYLAFWSAGKIADEKGYSEIYDLNNLRSIQIQELKALGFLVKIDDLSIPIVPAPYFSFFVPPFRLLSRVNPELGYWIWTIFNLTVLVGYLVFVLRKTLLGESSLSSSKKILWLMLLSFPVFSNLLEGQLNVFLLVCSGEFIRYVASKKPVLSGLWLGGLLLKPQLLILIIPIILIMRNWKLLMGFIISSGVILMTSLFLSGFTGMNELINLWTKSSVGMAASAPVNMINWRMVGVNLNTLMNISAGWAMTGLGITLTILAVYFLIKCSPPYGSPLWVMTILGVFSATLAITWHAHYAMALVLVPFLIYASSYKLLPEKIIFLWVVVTPVVMFGMMIFSLFVLFLAKTNINNYNGMVIAFSGFIFNLAILVSVIQFFYDRSKQKYSVPEGSPTQH
ncbi:MAG: DUF2029 domain-containing protein [Chloroflexi bacterium]|nr:MAG: DUF2029 domain-containing protein [Chloroflexota bacterium]